MSEQKEEVRLEGTKLYINNEVIDLRAQQAEAVANTLKKGYDAFAKLVVSQAQKWLGPKTEQKVSQESEGSGVLEKLKEARAQERSTEMVESENPKSKWAAT